MCLGYKSVADIRLKILLFSRLSQNLFAWVSCLLFSGERCSFMPSANLWYDGFCAFESIREASRYLLFMDGKFFFRKYDGTRKFKEDASFLFNKEVQSMFQVSLLKLPVTSSKYHLLITHAARKIAVGGRRVGVPEKNRTGNPKIYIFICIKNNNLF